MDYNGVRLSLHRLNSKGKLPSVSNQLMKLHLAALEWSSPMKELLHNDDITSQWTPGTHPRHQELARNRKQFCSGQKGISHDDSLWSAQFKLLAAKALKLPICVRPLWMWLMWISTLFCRTLQRRKLNMKQGKPYVWNWNTHGHQQNSIPEVLGVNGGSDFIHCVLEGLQFKGMYITLSKSLERKQSTIYDLIFPFWQTIYIHVEWSNRWVTELHQFISNPPHALIHTNGH